jgi:transcription-repair coupling factor (superfamily II helicase)
MTSSSFESKIILTSSDEIAQKVEQALISLKNEDDILLVPGFFQAGVFKYESSKKIIAKRLYAAAVIAKKIPKTLICTVSGFSRNFPLQSWIQENQFQIEQGNVIDIDYLTQALSSRVYIQTSRVEEVGEFSIRGSILDLWTPSEKYPTRIEFVDDKVDQIRSFRVFDQRSFATIDKVTILPCREFVWPSEDEKEQAFEKFNKGILLQGVTGSKRSHLLEDLAANVPFAGIDDVFYMFLKNQPHSFFDEISLLAKNQHVNLSVCFVESIEDLEKALFEIEKIYDTAFVSSNNQNELASKKDFVFPGLEKARKFLAKENSIQGSFQIPKQISDDISPFEKNTAIKQTSTEAFLSAQFSEFVQGDIVVHVQYGIARFIGLMTLKIEDITSDFLALEYAGGDKIYVPVNKLNLVQKYIGASDSTALDSLKGNSWEKRRERVRVDVEKIAKELMEYQAKRATTPGHAFSQIDENYKSFEKAFPFDETLDQLKAIQDIMSDMDNIKAMDRLLCGDVGFGKTEVAMRAAYRCVLDGKQVAWLVPTTVLAHQHFRSLKERFADFAVNVEMLDRSVGASSKILSQLKKCEIDILIGTHRLLSKDIEFRDLGLLVVDEEQRFGVMQKEKIKSMSYGVDILTLTATPIPRTLQMAMSGLRDLSLLTTPPKARLATKTFVCPFEDDTIQNAVNFEISRGGQIFYVHNRVFELESVQNYLQQLLPSVRIGIAHGKMLQKDLESKIISFLNGEFDILLCTTIIESGIDMPNVNTIIVQNADHFGLAQLYQLRGRVGRRSTRGQAYFLTSENLKDDAEGMKRLHILQDHQELGSGFIIASHDLEMRGCGNMLGDDQSGKVADVGLETYLQMLDDAIKRLGGKKITQRNEVEIQIPLTVQIPDHYIENAKERLRVYRRFFGAQNEKALLNLIVECEDRFGPMPIEVKNLSEMARIRRLLVLLGAISLSVGEDTTEIRLDSKILQPSENDEDSEMTIKRILDVCNHRVKNMRLTPDGRILFPLRKKHFIQDEVAGLAEIKRVLSLLIGELHE